MAATASNPHHRPSARNITPNCVTGMTSPGPQALSQQHNNGEEVEDRSLGRPRYRVRYSLLRGQFNSIAQKKVKLHTSCSAPEASQTIRTPAAARLCEIHPTRSRWWRQWLRKSGNSTESWTENGREAKYESLGELDSGCDETLQFSRPWKMEEWIVRRISDFCCKIRGFQKFRKFCDNRIELSKTTDGRQ